MLLDTFISFASDSYSLCSTSTQVVSEVATPRLFVLHRNYSYDILQLSLRPFFLVFIAI